MSTAEQVKDILIQEADSWLRAESLVDLDKLVRNKLNLAELGVPAQRREGIEIARLAAQAMAMQNAFLKDVRRAVADMGIDTEQPTTGDMHASGEC